MRFDLPYLAPRGLGLISFGMSMVLGYFACLGVFHLGLPRSLAEPAAVIFATLEVFKLVALNYAMNGRVRVLYRLCLALSYVAAMCVTAMALGAYQRHATSQVDASDAAQVKAYDDATSERDRLTSEINAIESQLGSPGRAVEDIEADAKKWASANLTCGQKTRDGGCAQQEAVLAELRRARDYDDANMQITRLRKKLSAVSVPELPDEVVARNARAKSPRSNLSTVDLAATLLRDWVLAFLEILLIGFVALKRLAMRLVDEGSVVCTRDAGVAAVVQGGVSISHVENVAKNTAKNNSTQPRSSVAAGRSTVSHVETWVVAHIQANGALAGTQREWAVLAGCSDSTMSLTIRRLVSSGRLVWSTGASGRRQLVALGSASPVSPGHPAAAQSAVVH